MTVPGKLLGIFGQAPSDSRTNRLHVNIYGVCFHSFEVYSIDSSKTIGKFREVLMNFNRLFLELNRFSLDILGSMVSHPMFKTKVFNALQTRLGPSKYTFLKTNPSKRNPKLKTKTSLEVLNIICSPQEQQA